MIAFMLKPAAYSFLQAMNFVLVDRRGFKVKFKSAAFMIVKSWRGEYSFWAFTLNDDRKKIPVPHIHHATEILKAEPGYKGWAEFLCHYDGDKIVEGGFEDDQI
jgi:hypothetical protein